MWMPAQLRLLPRALFALLVLSHHRGSAFSTTPSSPILAPDREVLPPRLQEAVSRGLIAQPRPNVYVLGTVHIGAESAEDASTLIHAVKPKAVVVEVAPSRLEAVRRKNKRRRANEGSGANGEGRQAAASTDPGTLLRSLPALAEKGWSTGGLGGLVFAVTIMWGSLLKKSFTSNEEVDALPRVDEFAAAVEAADEVGASVVACDTEIEALIGDVTRALGIFGWLSLGANIAAVAVGRREVDPVRRRKGESIIEWADRRRDVATARASRMHGEITSPGLSSVLVDDRDERFARYCRKVVELSGDASAGDTEQDAIVCVVGLVHLDGVSERLREEMP